MSKLALKSAFLFLISLFVFSLVTRDAVAATVVSPANMSGWAFQVQSPNGSGTFVTGPLTAPLGTGSARLFTGTNGNLSTSLYTSVNVGTELEDVSRLEYSAYGSTTTGSAVNQPFIYMSLSIPVTGGTTVDTLVFDPNNQSGQVPVVNSWSTWNALDGTWKSLSFGADVTIDQYISNISDAPGDITLADYGSGSLRLQVGPASSSDVFDGNVDNFTIGVNGSDATYDFEPTVATNNFQQNFFSGNFGAPAGSQTTYTPTGVPNMGGFSWGLGSPAPGVPADNFSARWTGTFNFDAATYRFVGNTNNGNDTIRIFVDGVLRVERTANSMMPMPQGTDPNPPQSDPAYVLVGKPLVMHGAMIPMTAGVHQVTVELVHTTGASNPRWSFWKPADCSDITADGIVNSGDQGVLARLYGRYASFVDQANNTGAILNGVTNSGDQGVMASRYGKTCPYN